MENLDESVIFSKETISELKKYLKAYSTKETLYEYVADDDGKLKISKKKVNKKVFPPNSEVLKILFQLTNTNAADFSNLTDEQLQKEKRRLLKILKEMDQDDN